MVCCAFPPTGGPGVQRSAKFAKYLPSCGWLPTVWSAGGLDGMPSDPTLRSELPTEVVVHEQRCDGRIRKLRRATGMLTGVGGAARAVGKAIDWRVDAWLARASMPDRFVSWARSSVRPLLQLIRRERIGAIFSTFSPASNHMLAMTLKRRTNLPWIADFRDLWTDDYRYIETDGDRRRAHRQLEREILEAADVVIGVTERQTRILAGKVPHLRHKFITITNGFDPADFASDVAPPRDAETFTISHIGRLDHWRTCEAWFEGLRRFVVDPGCERSRFRIRVVGHADDTTRRKLRATGAICEFVGYVTHREAVAEMRGADVLLLNVPDGPNGDSVIPAKLFEYLAAARPIVVIGPPGGECERIVQSAEAGTSVPFDPDRIAHALRDAYSHWRSGRAFEGCPQSLLESYSRSNQTRELASTLDELVTSPRAERVSATARAEAVPS